MCAVYVNPYVSSPRRMPPTLLRCSRSIPLQMRRKTEDYTPTPGVHVGFVQFLAMAYFLVCGGAYGTEDLWASIPPPVRCLRSTVDPLGVEHPDGHDHSGAQQRPPLQCWLPPASVSHRWSKEAFGAYHPMAGRLGSFVDGCILFVVVILDQALYPVIFIGYVQILNFFKDRIRWDDIDEWSDAGWWVQYGIMLLFIVFALLVNTLGMAVVGKASNIFVVLTWIPFLLLIVGALLSSKVDWTRLWQTEMPVEYVENVRLAPAVACFLPSVSLSSASEAGAGVPPLYNHLRHNHQANEECVPGPDGNRVPWDAPLYLSSLPLNHVPCLCQ
eukprot:gene2649-3330_t